MATIAFLRIAYSATVAIFERKDTQGPCPAEWCMRAFIAAAASEALQRNRRRPLVESLSARVFRLRIARGYSAYELAEAAGIWAGRSRSRRNVRPLVLTDPPVPRQPASRRAGRSSPHAAVVALSNDSVRTPRSPREHTAAQVRRIKRRAERIAARTPVSRARPLRAARHGCRPFPAARTGPRSHPDLLSDFPRNSEGLLNTSQILWGTPR